MPQDQPSSEDFDKMAARYALGALENIESEFAKFHRLPLIGDSRQIVLVVLSNLARMAISATAELSRTGTDVTFAVLPRPSPQKENPPPSPL